MGPSQGKGLGEHPPHPVTHPSRLSGATCRVWAASVLPIDSDRIVVWVPMVQCAPALALRACLRTGQRVCRSPVPPTWWGPRREGKLVCALHLTTSRCWFLSRYCKNTFPQHSLTPPAFFFFTSQSLFLNLCFPKTLTTKVSWFYFLSKASNLLF